MKKQDDIRKKYNSEKLKFYIGDVRDKQSVFTAMSGSNFVYHAAALKQVPSCEFYPIEAVKTNILGTENVLDAAIKCKVERVVCLSTDKAVYPINAMGMSKALMEKTVVAKARMSSDTIICATRYGNVMASRGSVIPLFVEQIHAGRNISITDPEMTRFMMTLDDAVDLVLYAFKNCRQGDIFVQKAPAVTIETLSVAIKQMMGASEHGVEVIGTRHGEKLFEVLLSREEMVAAEDQGDYFRVVPDLRNLNYGKYFDNGEQKISDAVEYNSHNTRRLSVNEMKKLLKNYPYFQIEHLKYNFV